MTGPRGWELREALAVLDKDLYDQGPGPERPYIEGLKNPCWKGAQAEEGSKDSSGLACLPYALVLGGFQCGSQSLFLAIYSHPLVVKSDVSRWHFWAEHDKTAAGYFAGTRSAADKIATWHRLTTAASGDASAAVAGAAAAGAGAGGVGGDGVDAGAAEDDAWLRRQSKVIVDGSASTFAFYWAPGVRAHRTFQIAMAPCWGRCHDKIKEGPERDQCLDECYPGAREADRKMAAKTGIPYNDVAVPLVMSAVYGKRPPKMVVLMRNPVDRLYSSFWKYGHYNGKYGATTEGFTKYVDEQLLGIRLCQERNVSAGTGISCLLHFETWGLREERLFFHGDQILRGVYSIYLDIWFKYFDKKQFLILRSEDYFADPLTTFRRTLTFLDLDPKVIGQKSEVERLTQLAASGDITAGGAKHRKKKMKAEGEDDRMWAEIKRGLVTDPEGRFAVNREAAQGQGRGSSAAEVLAGAGVGAGAGASSGDGPRPPMPQAVRKQLVDFYAPYNKQLAELLGDPDFIQGWE